MDEETNTDNLEIYADLVGYSHELSPTHFVSNSRHLANLVTKIWNAWSASGWIAREANLPIDCNFQSLSP